MRCVVLVVGAIFAIGCSRVPERESEPATSPVSQPSEPQGPSAVLDGKTTLGAIQMRDRALVIVSSGHGDPRYVVTSRDGVILSAELDADALAREHPQLAEALRTATAQSAPAGAYLDASVDVVGRDAIDAKLDF